MNLIQFIAKVKKNRITVLLVALGSTLAFVATFGKSLKEICEWTSFCSRSVPGASPIAEIALGQARSFIEQPSVLGQPQFPFSKKSIEGFDAQFELESDERALGVEVFQAVNTGKYKDAGEYYSEKYEFATYRKGSVMYVIRYRKSTHDVSAILLASADSSASCSGDNLRKLPDLQRVIRNTGSPLCLGHATFGDLFPNGNGSIRTPVAGGNSPAKCWGHLTSGGASGHGSGVEIMCLLTRGSYADPDLNYLIKMGTNETGLTEIDYWFDDHEKPQEKSFHEFLSKAKSYKPQYIVLFDPEQEK